MILQPTFITGMASGLTKNKKPFLLNDQAWSRLENAYCFRERIKKKEGNRLIGRLSRVLTGQALGNTNGAGSFTGNIVNILGLESTAELKLGSITITVGAQTFTEPATPDGSLTGSSGGTGSIVYVTGVVTLSGAAAAMAVTIDFTYYPCLPVMGIWQREQATINDEETIIFDTTYAYRWSVLTSSFSEFITGTTWSGTDADFFWAANYRGATPQSRLFFATNFVNNTANPIRYSDGTTWTSFNPLVNSTNNLYQARIIIPYYGRLLALNVYEGTTGGSYAGAVNIGNRCRFSQIGDPTAADAWREDQFGKGGFIDAPTSEKIISATFYKNTLIVGFERSTWQLRYVGEYGLPFIWERISTDFGTESTFSPIIFDEGVISVGDRAITSSSGVNVNRIDLDIPDQVFEIANTESGPDRVWGLRNFDKELVYWCYTNTLNQEEGGFTRKYPNRVLVYNYRNNTWAIFRDNVTCFGAFQLPSDLVVSWDSTNITWDDTNITWDDTSTAQLYTTSISGNQQGFIEEYATTEVSNEESLTVTAVTLTAGPPTSVQLTIKNHNLETGDIIYLEGLLFFKNSAPASTNLNDQIYMVEAISEDVVLLYLWDSDSKSWYSDIAYTPANPNTYIGGGTVALLPRFNCQTKDFNPYSTDGKQMSLSYIDFQTDINDKSDSANTPAFTAELYINSYLGQRANFITTAANQQSETYSTSPYYMNITSGSQQYAWHRFYATAYAQYIRLGLTLDDELMNDLDVHEASWELNAICLWSRPGGMNPF